MTLLFHPLTIADRTAVQDITLRAGRRNCNYTFANLVGWQFCFDTEWCVLGDALLLRYTHEGRRAYMVCTDGPLSAALVEALRRDSPEGVTLIGLEDDQVRELQALLPASSFRAEARRDQYDYLYRREQLATLRGKHLNAKRNHVHRFAAEHPGFEYRVLETALFDQCRRLTQVWTAEKAADPTIAVERRVMETVFAHWEELGMMGGCVFAEGAMVAFAYGAAVTTDTFDVCVEKADRQVEGAFAVINQQLALHLPELVTTGGQPLLSLPDFLLP